jgi:hypothetical protein
MALDDAFEVTAGDHADIHAFALAFRDDGLIPQHGLQGGAQELNPFAGRAGRRDQGPGVDAICADEFDGATPCLRGG